MPSVSNVFSPEELNSLTSLPVVLAAQSVLAKKAVVNFRVHLADAFKQKLGDALGLNLSNVRFVPFRWIRGDTAPHADTTSSAFENTYLVYLTDGEGEFKIGDEIYPIEAGTGFVFPEGTSHEVTGSNGTSRLLLGPMSEKGREVGAPPTYNVIEANANQTVYIEQIESGEDLVLRYKIDNGEWTLLENYQTSIENLTPEDGLLKVIFLSDILVQHDYIRFVILSNSVQFGDTSLKANGTRTTITVDGVEFYNGLLTMIGYSDIFVYNLNVLAINGSALNGGAGWIGDYFYGRDGQNNYIMNCSSEGDIGSYSGGIVGSEAATLGGEGSVDLNIIGCYSSGAIGEYAGGIIGEYTADGGGTVNIIKCSSSGPINSYAGGIVGTYSGGSGGTVNVQRCYTTGTIGYASGGIFANGAGYNGTATVQQSYTEGNIEDAAGGIFGEEAYNVQATNCYTLGSISETGGGIVGANFDDIDTMFINHCYIAGSTALGEGYIWATSDLTSNTGSANNYSEAANDTSGWNTTNANSVLQGIPASYSVGLTWTSVQINSPYKLIGIGPSPYLLETIADEDLTISYFQTIAAGNSTIPSVSSGYTFSILEINQDNPSSHPTIQINSTTGVISTTSETPIGAYQIVVYATINPYSTTAVLLTVEAAPAPAPASSTVSIPLRGKGFDFETYNAIEFGKRLIRERLTNTNIRFKSFEDYMKYKKAFPSFT